MAEIKLHVLHILLHTTSTVYMIRSNVPAGLIFGQGHLCHWTEFWPKKRRWIWFTLPPGLTTKNPPSQYSRLSFAFICCLDTETAVMDSKTLVGYWNYSSWIDSRRRVTPKKLPKQEHTSESSIKEQWRFF